MAGRETTGYDASTRRPVRDRPWVVVPGARPTPADVERVERARAACGARPMRMDAEAHDRAVAGISHLPLVLAAALVEAVAGTDGDRRRPDWPVAPSLAAGGWRDMTRLARGDVAMGAAIAATNAAALAGTDPRPAGRARRVAGRARATRRPGRGRDRRATASRARRGSSARP